MVNRKFKRRALLIGYSGYDIPNARLLHGVRHDIENMTNFLMSPRGGGWKHSEDERENEITIVQDEQLGDLDRIILDIKLQTNDVIFTYFSGHGDYDDEEAFCRRLEIAYGETILETKLHGLASKEILICDSCSGLRSKENLDEAKEVKSQMVLESAEDVLRLSRARSIYEQECNLCEPQELHFYAAKPDIYARDTYFGGKYTLALLRTAKNTVMDLDMVEWHDAAARMLHNQTIYIKGGPQEADCDIPKRNMKFLPGVLNV